MSSRIGSGTTSRGDGGGGGGGSGGPAGLNNVVPNLQSMRRSSPNSSSQYSQWRIQKDLGGRCSWKFVAIFFVLLSVILVSALIYTTGKCSLCYLHISNSIWEKNPTCVSCQKIMGINEYGVVW